MVDSVPNAHPDDKGLHIWVNGILWNIVVLEKRLEDLSTKHKREIAGSLAKYFTFSAKGWEQNWLSS